MNNQLKTTFIREGIKPVIPNDDVIQDGHIQQDATLLDLSGNLFIRLAWLCVAAGMVMPQDDAGRMLFQANLEDLFRIYYSPGDSAFGDAYFPEDPVGPVQ